MFAPTLPVRHALLLAPVFALMALAATGCRTGSTPTEEVVVYTSVDQVFAEPVLKAFEDETGIRVKPVFDVEATKAAGLATRIEAEAGRPAADVFWNGEFAQTARLKAKGLLQPYSSKAAAKFPEALRDEDSEWTGLTPRLRVWISGSGFEPRPIGIDEMPDLDLPGERMAVSNPLFGTASFQAAALDAILGEEGTRRYYDALEKKGIRVVPGNSVVRDLVVAGQATLGLTDSDDACGAVRKGAKVHVFLPRQTLMIPATVAIVKGAPHQEAARKLVDFLLGPKTEAMLVEAGFCQLRLHEGSPEPCLKLPQPDLYDVDLATIADHLQRTSATLRERFLR